MSGPRARSGLPGGEGYDPADPGRRRPGARAAAGIADLEAVPGQPAAGESASRTASWSSVSLRLLYLVFVRVCGL